MKERKRLPISCDSDDCENGEHSYCERKPPNKPRTIPTKCKKCGEKVPFDWKDLHSRNPRNIDFLIDCLRTEHIRAYFWKRPLSQGSLDQLVGLSKAALHQQVRKRINDSLGPAQPSWEGRQTPLDEDGNPIHYAQHATGTCCRRCLSYWHGIPEGQPLKPDEVEYSAFLVDVYLSRKLPTTNSTDNQQ